MLGRQWTYITPAYLDGLTITEVQDYLAFVEKKHVSWTIDYERPQLDGEMWKMGKVIRRGK